MSCWFRRCDVSRASFASGRCDNDALVALRGVRPAMKVHVLVPGQALVTLHEDPLAPGSAVGPMLSCVLELRNGGGDDVEGAAEAISRRMRIAALRAQLDAETAALKALQKRRGGAAV